jgi:hypothetical protein
MENKKKKIDGLLSLLANEATGDSRRLLKKYNREDATNHRDLESKLADLYKNCDDKLQIEKEFSAIHPHKNFIIKYAEITEKPNGTTIEAPHGVVLTEEKVKEILKDYIGTTNGGYSNCEGNPNCSCNKSSFSGYNESFGQPQSNNNNSVTVALSVIGIVAVLGIIMHHKHH